MSSPNGFAFGAFRLDLHNECLWQQDRAITLRPKAFAVLKLLVEHSGQLVTKQQVLDTVWPCTFVSDAVLKDSIRQLREALDDDAAAPTYIETAHRRGYRFIAKATSLDSTVNSTQAASISPPSTAVAQVETANGLLGREAELGKLRKTFERAVAGERQLMFVTGEAGIGKTAVVESFLQYIAGRPGVRIARGQCLEHYGAGEPYMPVLEAFSRLGRGEAAIPVFEALRNHAPAWLPQLPSLIPSEQREQSRSQLSGTTRERMLREMAEALESLTQADPLVLVLEDLHWSDYSSLDLISYVARRRDPARLMVIATYRPVEVIVREHPLKGVKRELQAHALCNELPLEYLSEPAVREYLASRFPDHHFGGRLSRLIYQRTEGNPLFMVNLVQYLVDTERICRDGGTWKLSAEPTTFVHAVPENMRQLIEKHVERLTPDERAVLEAATVAGIECCSEAIAAGLNKSTEWVEKHCQELAHRHHFLSPAWIVELPGGTITPRYRFTHVLYLEVPYSLIPPMRRAQIHQRIALRGIEIWGERANDIAAELAMHFQQCHDWPRALHYLIAAADNAAHRSAHHEASELAQRGLQVLAQLADTRERTQQELKLRLILGGSLMAMKGFASREVEEVFTPGRELFLQQGPSPELFHMLWSLGLYYQFGSSVQRSLEIGEQLLSMAEGLNDGALIMESQRAVGAALVILGRHAEGLTHLDKSTALYEAHRGHAYSDFIGRDCKVMCDSFAAIALWALGDIDAALQRMAIAIEHARTLRRPETMIVACHFAANLAQLQGDVPLVREYAQEAMNLADEYGLELWLAYGVIELGWAEAEQGNGQGIARMQRGLAAYEMTGARLWLPYFLGLFADQLAKASRVEEGLAAIEKALACAQASHEKYSLAELYRLKGELILKSAETQRKTTANAVQAQSCFAHALAIAKTQRAKSWEGRVKASFEGAAVVA
jgi:DNA-binding winged helix-turn-helix (wHTH) protein/predicted ATPase